jgi:hypothetical protein
MMGNGKYGYKLFVDMKTNVALSFTLLALMTTGQMDAQSLTASVVFEVTQTNDFARVLSARTIIRNEMRHDVLLTHFLMALDIEKLNARNQYENYFENWFAGLFYDSARKAIEETTGVVAGTHHAEFDVSFAKELNRINYRAKDSTALRYWVNHEVDLMETIRSHDALEFQTNLNSLPTGTYRIRFHYSSLKDSVNIHPVEKFKSFRIPERLLEFVRWRGEVDSGYVHFTIR